MIRSTFLFTLCGCFLCSQASAQDAVTPGTAETLPAKKVDSRKMYEDIEIMRRILQEKFEKLSTARTSGMGDMGMMAEGTYGGMELGMDYAGGMEMMGMPMEGAQRPALTIDGVYLSDHGIVFTANLQGSTSGRQPYPARDLQASACIQCHESDKQQIEQRFAESITNRPKALTDWEKTRQSVLGIQDTDGKTSSSATTIDICDPGIISELVWLVLGENGRHFSELPAEERVTVAITLGKPVEKQGSNPFGSGSGGGGRFGTGSTRFETGSFGMGQTPGAGSSDFGGEGMGSGTSPDAYGGYGGEAYPLAELLNQAHAGEGKSTYRDYLLLGDLHMKQNKPAEALKAYERALSTVAGSVEPTAETLKDAPTKTKLAIFDLHQKLAQAALANDQAEAAKTWIERLIALQKGSTSKTAPTEEAKRLALPERLIISSEKSLLDRVGSEITLEDFKTRAKVQHLFLKD